MPGVADLITAAAPACRRSRWPARSSSTCILDLRSRLPRRACTSGATRVGNTHQMNSSASAEERLRVKGADLAVRTWGDGSQPDVVLVHGHGTNMLTWLPLVDSLGEDFNVVAYDRRGHGCSTPADRYEISDLVGDLDAVCESQNLVNPIIVGHSVGAWESLQFAANRPDVAGVVCLDHAIASDDPHWDTLYPHRSRDERLAQAMQDTIANRGHSLADVKRLLAAAKADLRWRPWANYEPMIERGIRRSETDGLYWARPLIADRVLIEEGWESIVTEPYTSISCPIRLVLADRSPGTTHSVLRHLSQRRSIPVTHIDAGHDIHVERADRVAEIIRRLQ